MRFNKQELQTLASQSAHNFEKQGVLLLREKSESFFRRSEKNGKKEKEEKLQSESDSNINIKTKRKSSRESFSCISSSNSQASTERWFRLCGNLLFYLKSKDQWSEPSGVIVLESCLIRLDPRPSSHQPGFHFIISFDGGGYYLLSAGSETERNSWMEALSQSSFSNLRAKAQNLKIQIQERLSNNMLTNGHSKNRGDPNATNTNIPKSSGYAHYITESPIFEISLACDNLLCDTHGRSPNSKVVIQARGVTGPWIKFDSTEVVEKSSNPIFLRTLTFRFSDGFTDESEVKFQIYDVRERISQTQSLIGSISIKFGALRAIEKSRFPLIGAKDTPPGFISILIWNLEREEKSSTESTPCRSVNLDSLIYSHRRTQSLPPRFSTKLKIPLQNNFPRILSNPYVSTYRFHSGLGGDIFVHEIMAESKFNYKLPQQLLSIWISEEKELLQEMIGLGELREPWNSTQVQILERHLSLINVYTQAKQNLVLYKGPDFRTSWSKADPHFEFVPLNLHLQRVWALNESLHKSNFHDIITVGAFTAYSRKYEDGGLVKMLQNWKNFGEKRNSTSGGVSQSWYLANKVNMTYDSVQNIKRLRREIVERLQIIMKLAKERKTQGMIKFVEEIYHRCRLLLSICVNDKSLIEEAFEFLEKQRCTIPNSASLDMMDENKLCRREADEGIGTPNSPMRSIVEMFKKRNEKMGASGGTGTPDSGLGLEDLVSSFLDSPSANYYRPSEEPEPWDLTQLNIEASIISLNSKIRQLCRVGVGNDVSKPIQRSQSINNHTISPKIETSILRKSLREDRPPLLLSLPLQQQQQPDRTFLQQQLPNQYNHNNNQIDWNEELGASVRKLRLAMDGLLKTSRLAHSIFRLQENQEKADLGNIFKQRRDICFSHALTSLTSGLMVKLWCQKPDPTFLYILSRLGPLVSFHSFLTYLAAEAEMFNDMIVAIEDLKTVEFVLGNFANQSSSSNNNIPMPKVQGSRSNLKVILPVPDSVLALLPADGNSSFVVTPVLFNIGINEQATFSEKLGKVEPQEKSNLDNFSRLYEYYRRFKRLTLPVNSSKRNGGDSRQLDSLLDKMHRELLSKTSKNVEIIHHSAHITRLLFGIRFTSCKSGKDRTSMGCTLEHVQILSQEYDLAEHEFDPALNAMRSEGCRRENTLKNIGQRKYAFNSFQLFALPKAYRPPPGTFGSVQS